ncbi:hypothetical protein I312_105103 [Cryptococcus bacillisporus CA1280]|uniref:uncharacterized protein n=1 Tax=Cryptococcus bacillisporus CA1280 TaxID=1296109 RepID=UPI00336637BB
MSDGDYLNFSPYGYTPAGWVCVTFIILFVTLACVHTALGVKFKYWIVFPTLIFGCLLEIIGWAGRYWSNQNVFYNPPFLTQIITLIIAPVFFSAWCYTILGMGINTLGQQYSFSVRNAIGGGWAASVDPPTPKTPTNIMVGGIVFQLVSMIVFVGLAVDFMQRAMRRRAYKGREGEEVEMLPSTPELEMGMGKEEMYGAYAVARVTRAKEVVWRWRWVMVGTGICSIMIIVRGIYRSVELTQGWDGYLVTHEVYQDTLDGIPMIMALLATAVLHPGFFLAPRVGWKSA